MCGIAGLIDYRGDVDLGVTVSAMVESIRHRGPDGQGVFVRDSVSLGHARLSIIDHEGGRQPMSTPDGQIQLTYNGEVYNYRELRTELEGKGYKFRASSDTEVVLYAYEEWGKRCVEHLEGMFAFAVADFRKRELFLARDHFGIKPLLYRTDSKSFAFASEFQALMQLPDWTGEIDLYAIDLYLRYQYIPAPHTAFRKVFKLPAGHRMTVRMGESYQKIERYWEPNFSRKRKWNESELFDELDTALRDSVKR
ncbi:MAG TPA: asparagine synthetase B, partial [Planctomycetaceae bacterium]|nr:asparagine synthetase B [Planctomycetaceae bacterium]